ncbi:MAG TPA: hypothetical protein DCF63_16320, partial [Planctomycetaceae bacterium]|nr:hypothetical protein [Planctomycetaceae bacterium]
MNLVERKPGGDTQLSKALPNAARQPSNSAAMADLHSLPLLNLIEIPFARKYTVFTCLVGSILAGWLAIIVWPRTYVSHAELLFQVGRESVALDPTVTTSQTLLLQKSQEEDVNSALQILQSRQVLEMVVDKLGEDPILDGYLPSEGQAHAPSTIKQVVRSARNALDSVISASGLRDNISNREMAVMELVGAIDYEAPKKSTVITVEAVAKSPEMAQAIAQTVVNSFQTLHQQTMQTKGSLGFFVSQTELATKRLLEAQEKKRAFLEERNVGSIEAKQEILKDQLTS